MKIDKISKKEINSDSQANHKIIIGKISNKSTEDSKPKYKRPKNVSHLATD